MSGVSFIVTVYNKAAYLPPVLEALFAQSGNFQREFIIIDDGSTDGSWELLRRIAGRRADVKMLRQANAGPAIATNVAVRAATLPWLKIVDADDVLARQCTQILLEAATRLQLRLAWCHGIAYQPGSPLDLGDFDLSRIKVRRQNLFLNCLDHVPCNLSQTLIDRALYWQVGGCDERLFTQDYSLLLRLAWHTEAAEVEAIPLVASPIEAPGRVSDDQRRMLRETNMAMLFFLSETQGVAWRHRRRATERAFGRAWKWQRRKLGAGVWSRWFWFYALAQLAPPGLSKKLLASTLQAFGGPAPPNAR